MENKITDEIICRIFAQYPKSPIVICEPNTEPVSHYLEGVDFNLNQIIAERVNYNPQWIKLILKEQSKSTVFTQEIYHSMKEIESMIEKLLKDSNGSKDDFVSKFMLGGFLSNQYIMSKGYDMPQYLLGGKTLHEAGLAIYK